VDRSTGTRTGTRIRVVLDDWPTELPLLGLVSAWCVAVEVPILVRDTDDETVIRAERLTDKTVLVLGRSNPAARFILRTFDINSKGVEGQVAVIAYDDDAGEAWCDWWPNEKDLGGERLDKVPKLDFGHTALHGVYFGNAPVRTGESTQLPRLIRVVCPVEVY
jgi:hypothetical protein